MPMSEPTDHSAATAPAPSAAAAPSDSAARAASRSRPARRGSLLLLVGAGASGVDDRLVEAVAGELSERYEVERELTASGGETRAAARRAAGDGFEIVAALGGDGTVNAVANGLAGTETALACLPGGLTNAFSRGLGVPNDALLAARRLGSVNGAAQSSRVDLGTLNGRYFTFAAGVGLSAMLNRRVDSRPRVKGRLGSLPLVLAALASVRETYATGPRMRVSAGTEPIDAMLVVAQNADPLTYLGRRPIRLCGKAGVGTGTVSLVLLRESSMRELPSLAARTLSGRPARVAAHPDVASLPAVLTAEISSSDDRGLPVEVDGEYIGEHRRVVLGVAPAALAVVT